MPTAASSSDSESDANKSASDSEENMDEPVESLVIGRAKRSTAGNRLSSLIDKEQDDEIELLFAENELEEDESFDEDEDDGSDVNLGSSSDDEGQDAAQRDDDELPGEKELQQQARQDKKKRKAKEMARRPGLNRKRVKIDPTAIKTQSLTQPRPKKKSERVSWVASATDAPTRVSSRKQTVQNREVVHKRLVDNEKQRAKVMRQMEEAQRRKEAAKPKALTQAQRLEEAARIERKNAKSLTRWQESEAKRIAEQKAKLEALHDRQLSGPVVTWWSGIAQWLHGKVIQLGGKEVQREEKKEAPGNDMSNRQPSSTQAEHIDPNAEQDRAKGSISSTDPTQASMQQFQLEMPLGATSFLDGIHAYAALPTQGQTRENTPTSRNGGLAFVQGTELSVPISFDAPMQASGQQVQPQLTSRNLVALKNVDANAQRLPELQDGVLLRKHKSKLQSEFSWFVGTKLSLLTRKDHHRSIAQSQVCRPDFESPKRAFPLQTLMRTKRSTGSGRVNSGGASCWTAMWVPQRGMQGACRTGSKHLHPLDILQP